MKIVNSAIIIFVFALAGSSVVAQQTNFTTPTYGHDPNDPCAENKLKPDWFTERAITGVQNPEQRSRHKLRMSIYQTLAWEHIAETGQCGCEEEFPDPDSLKGAIEAVTSNFTTDFSQMRDTLATYRERRMAVVDSVLSACANNGR